MLPIRNTSYLLPICCSFWEKCKNSPKTGLGCSTPLKMQIQFFKSKNSILFESLLQLHHLRCKFKISLKMVRLFGCIQGSFVHCWGMLYTLCVGLTMVTITSHVFIHIFWMKCFSAVTFDMGFVKNVRFILIQKSPKVCKKVEEIRPDSFSIIPLTRK